MQAPSDDDLVKEYEENRRKFENEESEKSKFEKQSKLITSSLKHNLLQIRKGLATPSSLYDYQIDAVLKTADFFARSKPVPSEAPDMALIVAPPGSGKSGMVTLLPYVLSSKKVLILTPSQIISDQLAADFGRGEGTQPFFVKSGMFKRAECKKLLEPLFLARSTRDVVDYMEEGNLVIVNAQKFAGKAASSVSRVTIRPTEFSEKPAVSEVLNDPKFLEQLGKDIAEILGKHEGQERREKSPQAMILVGDTYQAKDVANGLGECATYIIADKNRDKNLKDFTKGVKKIAVVCGMCREGYDNSNVTLVVFLRKCQSSVLFEQFCGRCIRMHRGLIGKNPDKTVATVLSYKHFEQSKMWAAREKRAEEDPVEEEENEDGE
ncbi:putative ATP-dependent helicase IRC3 [Folsomia candida]|uniref:Putative ATP-dependent helicase IRC3 n=1 Tax=Folsomia candida TaxID=158441 RepID=A0A226DW60_FOLCA|nr:putative ATP-dependent helicase IRC3 [Folsomia candida]